MGLIYEISPLGEIKEKKERKKEKGERGGAMGPRTHEGGALPPWPAPSHLARD